MIPEQAGINLLRDTVDVLDTLGIRNFIVDGTLLGYKRENGFIPHDSDIDIGVFADLFDNELVAQLIVNLDDRNIRLHHRYGILSRFFELSFIRDNIKIDLFFYRKIDDGYIFHAFQNGGANLPDDVICYHYPAELIDAPMQVVDFLGVQVFAPADIEKFLETKYGADWRIPVKKWDWRFGPHNVVK